MSAIACGSMASLATHETVAQVEDVVSAGVK